MADTAIAITAGTGTNVDTRTEATNGNHRQVVVIGDPSTNAGVAPVDATNGLSVDVKASALPTGAATSAKQDTGNTSLSSIDGKITACNTGSIAGTVGADLRVGSAAVTTANPVPIMPPASGSLTISGTVTANAGTNLNTSALATESGGNLAAAATSLAVMDDWDNGASDGASVSGDVAHDTADAGEPVKVGMKAYTFDGTTPQAAVAEADRVNAIADLQGIQYVQTAHPAFFHVSADYSSAQTNTSLKAAPGAGSIYITDIMISNGATAGNITLLDGSGGTVLFEIYPAINGGVALNLKNPIKLTATTALCITSSTVTTHSVFVSGFVA